MRAESCAHRSGTPLGHIYFWATAPVAIPPRLLFTETDKTAGEIVNVPVYLPPPALVKLPIRTPVAAFHTLRDAAVLVLAASTLSWNERTAYSALLMPTESRG